MAAPMLAVRGSDGTCLLQGPPVCQDNPAFTRDPRQSKFMTYSRDGSLFSWCNGDKVRVVRSADSQVVQELALPKTSLLHLSPLNNILVTWRPYSKTADDPQGEPNLQLWDVHTGALLKALYQKKLEGWRSAQQAKNGPIYHVAWSPSSSQFCVVYGFMPAKATVYNLKCEPVFDFGTGPRNAAYYSPQGHILVLAGFGNLRGQMEVWDVKKFKQVCKPQAPDSTHFSWCPDGEHIVTATCSPRLRVSNGYKVWHYTGTVLLQQATPPGAELWEVLWQPCPDGRFPERPVKYQPTPGPLGTTQPPAAQAYRPPALRNQPASSSSKLHEEEPPQDMRPGAGQAISKAALKNQKKREAKKASRQEAKSGVPEPQSDPAPNTNSQSAESCGDPEMDKKIKNLKKKLKAIEELKEQQASGKTLQKNQLEKVEKEEELLKALAELGV
ncbi:hypothetical protein CRUP_007045 [Coryphaenoides rupestris]|nr:hypothetical protein CRUP_007045 [Coryphaenoides rupestris]